MLRILDRTEIAAVFGGMDDSADIVVVGKRPAVVDLGGGWTAQFYSDGIATVRQGGGAPADWYYNFDANVGGVTATASIPPSITATNSGITYHFTSPTNAATRDTGGRGSGGNR